MKTASRWAAALTLFGILLTAVPAGAAEASKRGVVNINSAEAAQLALLPRVGPSVAGRIVEFRKKNGPFKSAEDLMLVRGIGERTFALLKPYVTTSGQTTLTEKVRGSRAEAKQGSR
jgi:competence protein ComEA